MAPPESLEVDQIPAETMAENTPNCSARANDLQRQARCLLSIACLVGDAAKHDQLQQKAQELLTKAERAREIETPITLTGEQGITSRGGDSHVR